MGPPSIPELLPAHHPVLVVPLASGVVKLRASFSFPLERRFWQTPRRSPHASATGAVSL